VVSVVEPANLERKSMVEVATELSSKLPLLTRNLVRKLKLLKVRMWLKL
jgi:hypothetical protein